VKQKKKEKKKKGNLIQASRHCCNELRAQPTHHLSLDTIRWTSTAESSCRIMGPAGKLLPTTSITNWNPALKLTLLPNDTRCSWDRWYMKGEHTLRGLARPQLQRCLNRKTRVRERCVKSTERAELEQMAQDWRMQHVGSFRSDEHLSLERLIKWDVKTRSWIPPKELCFKGSWEETQPKVNCMLHFHAIFLFPNKSFTLQYTGSDSFDLLKDSGLRLLYAFQKHQASR